MSCVQPVCANSVIRPAPLPIYSPRNRARIATLATRGLTDKQIGRELHLPPRTVSTHLSRISPKLNVTTKARLPRRTLSQRPAPAETATNETSTVTNTAVHIHRAVHPWSPSSLGPTPDCQGSRPSRQPKPNLRSRRAEPARCTTVDEQRHKKLTLAQIAAEFDVVSRRSTATPDENAPPARLLP